MAGVVTSTDLSDPVWKALSLDPDMRKFMQDCGQGVNRTMLAKSCARLAASDDEEARDGIHERSCEQRLHAHLALRVYVQECGSV